MAQPMYLMCWALQQMGKTRVRTGMKKMTPREQDQKDRGLPVFYEGVIPGTAIPGRQASSRRATRKMVM